MKKTLHLILFVILLPLTLPGQQEMKQNITRLRSVVRFESVENFYKLNNYEQVWGGHLRLENLFTVLDASERFGLEKEHYQFDFISDFRSGKTELKSAAEFLEADIRFTDAALEFFDDLKNGIRPGFAFNGLKRETDPNEIPLLLKKYAADAGLEELAAIIQPQSIEYKNALRLLGYWTTIVSEEKFSEIKITSAKINQTNKPLLLRLYQLGITDSVPEKIADTMLKRQVKKAQEMFDVLNDGILRSTSLQAFNIPLGKRIEELKQLLNTLRWMEHFKQWDLAVVNIPAAWFYVYEKGDLLLDSKIIAGKKSTPTPTLSSTISGIVLYPYWTVPFKIATRELLPSIKQNIGFLEANNFQVLNNQGKILDPYKINWHQLSENYFPYTIRQSTGCDNSLGIVKFNFENPFSVYLHDTPGKAMFLLNKRYFSHGCMRVEKPVDLARLLLGNNRVAIDTLTEKGCLDHQSPLAVPVEKELPLLVIYNTAWFDTKGVVKFFDDVYEKNTAGTGRPNRYAIK